MDTLSSSVSTIKVPRLPPPNREIYHFKTTPYAATNRPPQPQFHASSISKPNLIPKTKYFSHKDSSSFSFPSSQASSFNSSSVFYRKPATGYAAALIEVAQGNNSLHLVQKDVHRLLNLFRSVNFQSQIDSSTVDNWKFHRHLVVLMKMLVKKNKIGIVKEVLEEFERIYEELCGTQVVLVSSEKKIREDEILGIAKSVQQLSGAMKVKVMNLVNNDGLPSYAV